MLGRLRRTTRTDVGLTLPLCGVAYLVWVLASGVARETANQLSMYVSASNASAQDLPAAARWLHGAFVHAAPVCDVLGVLWLVVSLALIVGASRQRWSISWAWMCGICQAMAATLVSVWSNLAAVAPYRAVAQVDKPVHPAIGWTSLSVAVAVALALWVTALVWLLYERARLGRGPTLRDGLRTHVPG